MNNQGHDETVTIRMPRSLLTEIDRASYKLRLFTPNLPDPPAAYVATRSTTIRFLIKVGLEHLKNGPPAKGPQTGKKAPVTR